MGRREIIADAGIRLLARGGARALTHLSVDKEAGLPRGSTSYYARTRRELTALVVDRLSEDTGAELDANPLPTPASRGEAVAIIVGFLDRVSRLEDAQAARLALLFELRHDPELRALLTAAAPVRAPLIREAEKLLAAIGVADPPHHAMDLVGLVDALLMYRTAKAAPVDTARVLHAYLAGLPHADNPPYKIDSSE